MTERYSFSLTTFSPSGKLVQIEYGLAAVAAGAPTVGIKGNVFVREDTFKRFLHVLAKDGVVLASENKMNSILFEEFSVNKVEQVSENIGMTYSGMGPDFRVLVKTARKKAQEYSLMYGEPMPTTQLVQQVAMTMQEYTQSGGVRPFGVSLLVAGWDSGRPFLFQCDPSGAFFPWKATALGKNYVNGRTFLEKRYNEELELDDAIHTALLTLKESFDVGMTEDNVEIGMCNKDGFHRLSKQIVKDHLSTL